MRRSELSTLTYSIAIQRCWQLLADNGYPAESISDPFFDFTFGTNGCSHCSLSFHDHNGIYITVATKLDAKPEPNITGMKLNSAVEPDIFVIVEQMRVDNEWKTLYENPSYS